MMSELKIALFKLKVAEEALKFYSAQESYVQVVDAEGLKHLTLPSDRKFLGKNPNPVYGGGKIASAAIKKMNVPEDINWRLLNNNPVVVYGGSNEERETMKKLIDHELIIDGSEISKVSEIQKIIETVLDVEMMDLSNANLDKKAIVMIENYGLMLKNMSSEEAGLFRMTIRNAMENEESLLFVLIDIEEKHDNLFLQSDLIDRLIPFRL